MKTSATENIFNRFVASETSPSLLLALAAAMAMLVANSSLAGIYASILSFNLAGLSLHHWINDGLMVLFFFFVGLEIKKEIVVGELSSTKRAFLPAVAAIGGMLVPAAIYLCFNSSQPERNGWGIPMATDIAFAVGVLAIFGRRVPVSLKIFLLAIAIVDDLGAILAIAFFYTNKINFWGLTLAAVFFAFILIMQRKNVHTYWPYWLVGAVVWFGILISGIHATIAGVVLGLSTPITFLKNGDSKLSFSPLNFLTRRLHHWVNLAIMPIFALANAGISFANFEIKNLTSDSVFWGILFGLVVGKPLGISLFATVFTKLGIISLPKDFSNSYILAAGCLAGIGFTMSIFISGMALPEGFQTQAKLAVVFSSLIAAITSLFFLNFILPKKAQ